MHLSKCILLAAYLLTSALAFYPHMMGPGRANGRSEFGMLESRFFPWKFDKGIEDVGYTPPTAKLKRILKLVCRMRFARPSHRKHGAYC
jgi:hypothetical protein